MMLFLFRKSIASMNLFELIYQKNASCMISNSISTVHILPEVIYIWSFEVSIKGLMDYWLEVAIDSSVWSLCLMYSDALNVILSS